MDHVPEQDAGAGTWPQPGRGTNQSGMREHNERLVLTLLRRRANLAKADIARETGLSAQTASRLIGTLEAEGLILRGKPQRGRIGQPSVPLSLNPEGVFFLGLKVGRRTVELVLTDFMGRIREREKKIYGYPDFDAVMEFARASHAAICARMPVQHRGRIAGMGVAMPFHLWNWAAMIGVAPERMANWQTRDLGAELRDALSLPVFVQNDASAACSAELVFSHKPLPSNFLCFYLAFFVGGGLALGNRLYTGATGNAAGFGPLLVPDLDGEVRPLIDIASLASLEKSLQQEGCDTVQIWRAPEGWDLPQATLEAWVRRAAHGLAHAILATQTILDLEAVLIDGWLPRALLDRLTERVQADLDAMDMTGMARPAVGAGTVGVDARALGAASLPLSARFLVD